MQVESGAENQSEVANPYANASQLVSEHPVEEGGKSDDQLRALAILNSHIIRSANWFYWIAGLSVVNLVAVLIGANFRFLIGLGFSEALGEIAQQATANGGAEATVAVCYVIGFACAGFFAACGWFARRPSNVAFIVGAAVFALDTLVFVFASDWIGVAFHGLALYYLWRGIQATMQYKKISG
ncbi:MAG TPA: hypothetical protein VIF60_21590 [Burkholderiaceae bacterium]|jgi:hypothetical protein